MAAAGVALAAAVVYNRQSVGMSDCPVGGRRGTMRRSNAGIADTAVPMATMPAKGKEHDHEAGDWHRLLRGADGPAGQAGPGRRAAGLRLGLDRGGLRL